MEVFNDAFVLWAPPSLLPSLSVKFKDTVSDLVPLARKSALGKIGGGGACVGERVNAKAIPDTQPQRTWVWGLLKRRRTRKSSRQTHVHVHGQGSGLLDFLGLLPRKPLAPILLSNLTFWSRPWSDINTDLCLVHWNWICVCVYLQCSMLWERVSSGRWLLWGHAMWYVSEFMCYFPREEAGAMFQSLEPSLDWHVPPMTFSSIFYSCNLRRCWHVSRQ